MTGREGVLKPVSVVGDKKPYNALPAEKPVKAVTLNAENCSP
jgi:hypothetical protein